MNLQRQRMMMHRRDPTRVERYWRPLLAEALTNMRSDGQDLDLSLAPSLDLRPCGWQYSICLERDHKTELK